MLEPIANLARRMMITPDLARQWVRRKKIVQGNECWWLVCKACSGRFADGGCNIYCSQECADGVVCDCPICIRYRDSVTEKRDVTETVTSERDSGVTQPAGWDYHEWCEALELVNSLKARIIVLEERVAELESKRDPVKEWDGLPPAMNTSDSFPPWGA